MIKSFPPQPSVEHLTTIFRRIESGKIVVPAFQRTFVWDGSDILDLLQSVHSGYPIGSILLWSADHEVLRVSESNDIPFPRLKPEYPVNYVLDGLQRLSSLYGVFHYQAGTHSEKFDISFDIDSGSFVHSSDSKLFSSPVPLNSLFNPRRLLELQKRFVDQGFTDRELAELTELQARFQEYMIPLVTLTERDVHEVVTIFERVNSTGTRLSRVDFMRAITWSQNFDLNQALDNVRESLILEGFDLPDETVVKALGLVFDLDPLADILLDLRHKSATELHNAMHRVVQTFKKAFSYLRQYIGVFSYEFVPYEGQVLTFFKVFLDREQLTDDQAYALKSWFFWVSFEEFMQGRPDNLVARVIRNVNSQIEDEYVDFPATRIEGERFIRRRMLKGKALTTGFLTMLNARALEYGGAGAPAFGALTREYDTSLLVPVLTLEEVREVRAGVQSAKVPANVILAPLIGLSDGAIGLRQAIIDLAQTSTGLRSLEGQFVDGTAIDALLSNDAKGFLERRAQLIADAASSLVGYEPKSGSDE